MQEKLLLILGLLFVVMLLVMLAQKLRIAYPTNCKTKRFGVDAV